MMLRHLQRTGHRPIALVGGGTTKVGDPSGKDESRQLLTQAQIDANKRGIEALARQVPDFGAGGAVLVDNAEWLGQLGYIPFLRDFGTHFTINRMLTFDSVQAAARARAAADAARVQLHGDAGLRLPRAVAPLRLPAADGRLGPVGQHRQRRRARPPHRRQPPVRPDHAADHHGLRPEDGQDRGRRGLAGRRRAARPFEYWQYWRNTEDADVGRFLRLFTELPLDEIDRLERAGRVPSATRPRRCWRSRRPGCATASTRPSRRPPPRGRCSRAAARASTGLPVVTCDARAAARRAAGDRAAVRGRPRRRRTARRGGWCAAAAPGSTTSRSTTRPRPSISTAVRDGHIKLSAGRKRHVLVRPA